MGAGASCPYGYPSGARLRERVCLPQGFWSDYNAYGMVNQIMDPIEKNRKPQEIKEFTGIFNKSMIKSIDKFMANNPKLATIGKYIIAFEVLRAEKQSKFGEDTRFEQEKLAYNHRHGNLVPESFLSQPLFQGGDWYFYLYNRIIEGKVGKDALPNFSNGNLAFITFNYDRSLEHYFYESLCNSFSEVSKQDIVKCLESLRILHVYGQIVPLKWQDPKYGVDYGLDFRESLLQKSADNIKTIYEQEKSPELEEARKLLSQAEQIFFLGFGYAPENMEILGLPGVISPPCFVYGTAFNLIQEEVHRILTTVNNGRKARGLYIAPTKIESGDVDCLMLLRKHLT